MRAFRIIKTILKVILTIILSPLIIFGMFGVIRDIWRRM